MRGRPAVKAQAGAAAQQVARDVARSLVGGQREEATALLEARVRGEGATISRSYAAKQAKAVANEMFATAGGLTNAAEVFGKVLKLPEIRILVDLSNWLDESTSLDERLVANVVSLIAARFQTRGTRHASDQNALEAILVALVDEKLAQDRLITAVAELLGVQWHAVKRAIERRAKIMSEEIEQKNGIWTQHPRSTRCDKYELPGFYEFQHDETFFRFVSSRSTPLREHIGLREYKARGAPAGRERLASPHTTTTAPPLATVGTATVRSKYGLWQHSRCSKYSPSSACPCQYSWVHVSIRLLPVGRLTYVRCQKLVPDSM